MVTDLILVCMMCGCNMYVIPRSVSRKDLGYKKFTVELFAGMAFARVTVLKIRKPNGVSCPACSLRL